MAELLEDLSKNVHYSMEQLLDALPKGLEQQYVKEVITGGRGLEILTRGFMYATPNLSVICNKPYSRYGDEEKQITYGADGHNFTIYELNPNRLEATTELDGFGLHGQKPVIFEAGHKGLTLKKKKIIPASKFLQQQFGEYSTCVFVRPGKPGVSYRDTISPHITGVYTVKLAYDFTEFISLIESRNSN